MNAARANRLLVVEDNLSLREMWLHELQTEPDIAWIGGAGTVREALQLLHDDHGLGIGLILLDLNLPDGDGWEVVDDLRRRSWPGRVVLMTGRADEYSKWRARRPPVVGYFDKATMRWDECLEGIRRIREGQVGRRAGTWPGNADHANDAGGHHLWDKIFSTREFALLERLAEGATNDEVAAEFGLKASSVQTFRQRIMRKLGLGGSAALVTWGRTRGFGSGRSGAPWR